MVTRFGLAATTPSAIEPSGDTIIGGKGADIMRGMVATTPTSSVWVTVPKLGDEYITDGNGFDTLHFEGVTLMTLQFRSRGLLGTLA